ncbi:MAG: DUF4199 domain-containing protein [Bacteroidales bacterium]|nr:DUF4199 domain-containing protein [Bacteroidales bacterium]
MKNWFKVTIIWGCILGAGFSALEVLKMLARKVDYPFGTIADLMMILLIIAVLVKSAKVYKDNYSGGFLSFGKSFGLGVGTVIFSFLFYLLYLCLHYTVVEPNGMQRINKSYEQRFIDNLTKDTVSVAEVHNYLVAASPIIRNQADTVFATMEDTACVNKLKKQIDDLYFYFAERVERGQEVDTAHYFYGTFDKYAQQVLLNTNELIINNAQDSTPCFTQLSMISLSSAAKLDTISPLKLRFEAQKSTIPHYDNWMAVALMNAFVVLLYGLFFNIFTSLYIYRKKDQVCGASQTDESQETKKE